MVVWLFFLLFFAGAAARLAHVPAQFWRCPGALPRYGRYFRAYGAKALLFVRGLVQALDFDLSASGHTVRAYAAVCLVKDTLAHAVFSSDLELFIGAA